MHARDISFIQPQLGLHKLNCSLSSIETLKMNILDGVNFDILKLTSRLYKWMMLCTTNQLTVIQYDIVGLK